MKAASRRSEELRAVAAELVSIHDTWVAAANRPNPDSEYFDAVDAVLESFDAGEIPGDCRVVADAVKKLEKEVEVFNQRDDEDSLYPRDEFWSAIQGIREVLTDAKQKELPPLESIQELEKQKVSHVQIARMYGLLDHRGNPQPHLVQRELDKPGSVIGSDWIDPRIKERDEQENAAGEHANRLEAKHKAAAKSEVCAETVDELWEQKVSVRQAAKMLLQSEEDVQAEYSRLDSEAAKRKSNGKADLTPPTIGKRKRSRAKVS